jgi:hypothetical protein
VEHCGVANGSINDSDNSDNSDKDEVDAKLKMIEFCQFPGYLASDTISL